MGSAGQHMKSEAPEATQKRERHCHVGGQAAASGAVETASLRKTGSPPPASRKQPEVSANCAAGDQERIDENKVFVETLNAAIHKDAQKVPKEALKLLRSAPSAPQLCPLKTPHTDKKVVNINDQKARKS